MPTVCFIHAHIESSQIGETPNSPLVPLIISEGTGRALGGKGGSRRPGQVFEEKVEHLSAKMRKFHKHM